MRTRARRLTVATVATVAAGGLAVPACAPVHSTAFRTSTTAYAPNTGAVYVSGARDPVGGAEVGDVQASGVASIEYLIPEIVARTAQLGGNYARVDRITTRYEVQIRPYSYSYNCGSPRFPISCAGTSYRPEEVGLTVVQGRAFRVESTPR